MGDEEGDEEGDKGDKAKGKRKAEVVKGDKSDKGKGKIIKAKGIEDLACRWYHDSYYDHLYYYAY